jgi:hypothetical protein
MGGGGPIRGIQDLEVALSTCCSFRGVVPETGELQQLEPLNALCWVFYGQGLLSSITTVFKARKLKCSNLNSMPFPPLPFSVARHRQYKISALFAGTIPALPAATSFLINQSI